MAREKFKQFMLDWQKRDIEQRLLFPGGRYTRVNNLLSGLLGLLLTGLFYGTIGNTRIAKTAFGQIFLERGETQHLVVLLDEVFAGTAQDGN